MDEKYQYNEVLTKLTYLTKRNNLSNTEIGKAIDVERRAMAGRAERNSTFKPVEVKKIESAFGVNLDEAVIINNSLARQNDKTIEEKYEGFGVRLTKIQDEHEYLDKDMAKLLKISEQDYIYLKCGDLNPDIEILNKIKQYFEVSIDWLLYGD